MGAMGACGGRPNVEAADGRSIKMPLNGFRGSASALSRSFPNCEGQTPRLKTYLAPLVWLIAASITYPYTCTQLNGHPALPCCLVAPCLAS